MTPIWEDSHGALWQGDVRACLAAMAPESVQCVVTSPPYWGLRSYSTAPQIWGGSPDCDHMLPDVPVAASPRNHNGQGAHGLQGHGSNNRSPYSDALWSAWQAAQAKPPMTGGSGPASAQQVGNAGSQFGNAWAEHTARKPGQVPQSFNSPLMNPASLEARSPAANGQTVSQGATCTRCGAWRGELGSEPLHDCAGWATGAPCGQCFICHLVEVFTAVKRVLRSDGVCLVNLGDSYAANGTTGGGGAVDVRTDGRNTTPGDKVRGRDPMQKHVPPGLKAKDLVGIPWRFALAMQASGWWLRGDYIWSKANPMPESVTDRCTRSHEYIFHFSKASAYYWDADAIRESAQYGYSATALRDDDTRGWDHDRKTSRTVKPGDGSAGRNARSVWEIATHAYPEAHFATFPPEIPRRAIRAGTSERGACAVCGAPWRRVVERESYTARPPREHNRGLVLQPGNTSQFRADHDVRQSVYQRSETTGWAPTCSHLDADVVPCRVLDIFSGAGTSVLVARQLGRYGVGIELNPEYVEMSLKRLQQGVLL